MWQMLEMIASGSMPRQAYPMIVLMTVFLCMILGAAVLLLGAAAKWLLAHAEFIAEAVMWLINALKKAWIWAAQRRVRDDVTVEPEPEPEPEAVTIDTTDGYEGLRLVPSYLRKTSNGFLSPDEYHSIGETA